MFNEQLFVESIWATGLASVVFACIIIAVMILVERIIR